MLVSTFSHAEHVQSAVSDVLRGHQLPPVIKEGCVATRAKIGHIGLETDFQSHVIEVNMAHFSRLIATYKTAVLTRSCDIIEENALHLAAPSPRFALRKTPVCIFMIAVGTRISGHINGLGLAPPYVTPQAKVHLNVAECDVTHGSFVAILNAQATVTARDDAVVKAHMMNGIHVLAADFDSTRA